MVESWIYNEERLNIPHVVFIAKYVSINVPVKTKETEAIKLLLGYILFELFEQFQSL